MSRPASFCPAAFWCILLLAAFVASCGDMPGVPAADSRRVLLVRAATDPASPSFTGSYRMGVWIGHSLYCVTPFRRIELDDSLRVVRDSLLDVSASGNFLAVDPSGAWALQVREYAAHLPYAQLKLWNLATGEVTLLKDSTSAVSSARFLHLSNGFIYYSYGDSKSGTVAGYYHYDFESGVDSLILAQPTVPREREVVNGFDISPDDERLIYPIHTLAYAAKIGEYNIRTGERQVLPFRFEHPFLWLRYDPTGGRLLYCNHFAGVGGATATAPNELGILERRSLRKIVFPIRMPDGWGVGSGSVFPDWSPDGRNIVFGNPVGTSPWVPGVIGGYSLYILPGVDGGGG